MPNIDQKDSYNFSFSGLKSHVINLVHNLKQRKEEVQIGDRIPYIYIESDDPKQQKSELGEDPRYAIQNKLKMKSAFFSLNFIISVKKFLICSEVNKCHLLPIRICFNSYLSCNKIKLRNRS